MGLPRGNQAILSCQGIDFTVEPPFSTFPGKPFSKQRKCASEKALFNGSFIQKHPKKTSSDSLYFTLAIIWLANSSPSYRYIYIYMQIYDIWITKGTTLW